jgi:hypothetical protein
VVASALGAIAQAEELEAVQQAPIEVVRRVVSEVLVQETVWAGEIEEVAQAEALEAPTAAPRQELVKQVPTPAMRQHSVVQ